MTYRLPEVDGVKLRVAAVEIQSNRKSPGFGHSLRDRWFRCRVNLTFVESSGMLPGFGGTSGDWPGPDIGGAVVR